jgi:hypothetical protein
MFNNVTFLIDGRCQIVAKEKHICKKCRYEKCLSVGMDAKWVLSNEEVFCPKTWSFNSYSFFMGMFCFRKELDLKSFSNEKKRRLTKLSTSKGTKSKMFSLEHQKL